MVIADKITIREVLRGMNVGRMQSVGLMSVIPLTMDEDLHDERFASPMEINASTSSYGTMVFDNKTDSLALIPLHAGIVDKRQGQDHAMSVTGLIRKGGRRSFNTAMCIQASQAGMIRGGSYSMLILPHALREAALRIRGVDSYGKLWDKIAEFNKSVGARADGHLEYFLDKYKNELDQFVAEFENVPGQCGAIILVNGTVVGIERAPSPRYWRSIWEALIRECYGSVAIQVKYQMGDEIKTPHIRIKMREVSTLPDLENALEEVRQQEEERSRRIIRDLLDDPFSSKKEDALEGLTVATFDNAQFTGQAVMDSEKITYASLFTKASWAANATWQAAEEFTI